MQKVMIVEDEEILRSAYVTILTAEKFKVVGAANGKIALDLLQQNAPQLIILDVLMPVMGGIEFLQHANVRDNYPNIKVIVLSNLSDKNTIQEVIELGATKHYTKSNLSPGQLVATVRELLQ